MIQQIGARINRKISDTAYTVGFFGKTLRGIGPFFWRGKVAHRVLTMQVLFTFVEALGTASLQAMGSYNFV